MYRLIFLTGPYKGKRLAVQQGTVTIGRDPDCHIHLSDDEVSWQHAVIEERGVEVFVRDLGSTNRIVVNGDEVREARLTHGDEIEMGRTRLRFQVIQPAVAQQARVTSHVQGITFAAVALIIVLEVVFLAALAIWRSDRDEWTLEGQEARLEERDRNGEAEKQKAPEEEEEEEAAVEEEKERDEDEEEPEVLKEAERASRRAREREKREEEELKPIEPPPEREGDRRSVEELSRLAEEMVALDSGRAKKEEKKEEKKKEPEEQPPEPAVVEKPEPPEARLAPPPFAGDEDPDDPLLELAREMLEEARLDIKKHNFVQADEQLERIQIVTPDYFPAYAERAKLFEDRAMFKEAGEQWAELIKRSAGTAWYNYATAERQRVAQKEAVPRGEPPAGARREPKRPKRMEGRIRIDSVQQQKLSKTDEFDEMTLVSIVLRTKSGSKYIQGENVKVTVAFFDREKETGDIVPTNVFVPEEVLEFEGEWKLGERRTVSAAYIVPPGFREEEVRQSKIHRSYYGYVVRVYLEGALQDAQARPRSLINLVADEDISPR